jgi:hypothetical protein
MVGFFVDKQSNICYHYLQMQKKHEIVIAQHDEDLSWVPKDWADNILIYSSGVPTRTLEDRFLSERLLDILKSSDDPHFFNNDKDLIYEDGHLVGMPYFGGNPKIKNMLYLVELLRLMKDVFSCEHCKNKHIDSLERIGDQDVAKTIAPNNLNSLESEKWLTHIINRYDQLADVTIFIQGHPQDHISYWRKLNDLVFDENFQFCNLPNTNPKPLGNNRGCIFDEAAERFYKVLFNQYHEQIMTCWAVGAEFAASKEVIRSKPVDWYRKVRDAANDFPYSAHSMERLWWNVLGKPNVTNFNKKQFEG